MCGNAILCVAKYVYDRNLINKNQISIETLAGIKYITVKTDEKDIASTMTVDMGEPIIVAAKIPVISSESPVTNLTLSAYGSDFTFTCVSMGNPHAVTFIGDDVKSFDVERY